MVCLSLSPGGNPPLAFHFSPLVKSYPYRFLRQLSPPENENLPIVYTEAFEFPTKRNHSTRLSSVNSYGNTRTPASLSGSPLRGHRFLSGLMV